MKKILFTAILACTLLSCNKSELKIEISETPVSQNFMGNGVEWSAYPHGDSPDAEWGYMMTDDKLETVYKRLDFIFQRGG